MKVVLASASPRRKRLLKQINLSFSVDPSNISEQVNKNLSPNKLVTTLAEKKGRHVASKHPYSLIIAADTIVWFNKTVLGKPASTKQAVDMLKQLSGNTHSVFTGVYVARTSDTKIVQSFSVSERTKVTFGTLSEKEIESYILTNSPFDKAGAYGIQDDMGCLFVKNIDGDYYNVVGFPLFTFYQQLKIEMPDIHEKLFLKY